MVRGCLVEVMAGVLDPDGRGRLFILDGWETLPAVMVARGCLVVLTAVMVCPKIKENVF